MGISLDEQERTPAFELDAIIAVDVVVTEYQREQQEEANRRSA